MEERKYDTSNWKLIIMLSLIKHLIWLKDVQKATLVKCIIINYHYYYNFVNAPIIAVWFDSGMPEPTLISFIF